MYVAINFIILNNVFRLNEMINNYFCFLFEYPNNLCTNIIHHIVKKKNVHRYARSIILCSYSRNKKNVNRKLVIENAINLEHLSSLSHMQRVSRTYVDGHEFPLVTSITELIRIHSMYSMHEIIKIKTEIKLLLTCISENNVNETIAP